MLSLIKLFLYQFLKANLEIITHFKSQNIFPFYSSGLEKEEYDHMYILEEPNNIEGRKDATCHLAHEKPIQILIGTHK